MIQKTPSKNIESPADDGVTTTDNSCPNSLVVSEDSGSDSDSTKTASKPPCSKLFSKLSEPLKRPAAASAEESESTKKDKKKVKPDETSSTGLRSSSRQGKNSNKQ